MRQQRLVGRLAVQHRGGQQRRVEPAAVLVRAFQIEVGQAPVRRIGGRIVQVLAVRAADHRPVRGARVEPDVQRVAVLFVHRGVGFAQLGQERGGVQRLPGLDAVLLDLPGHGLEQLRRARVERAGFLVDEEGHRHAPLALARQRPVRPVGDHVVQPLLAPGRVERGRLDAGQRGLAQRRTVVGRHHIHAGEPLRGRAVDDRRLVPPAVHVAVLVAVRVEQVARGLQRLDDARIRVPDRQAAEQRQPAGIDAVAHHRAQDVLVAHAVRLAGLEVLDAVGRRRMDDAGAGIGGHIVAEVDRRGALVARVHLGQRMVEAHLGQRRARAGRDDLAFELIGLELFLDALGGQDQEAARCVDQRVFDLRMQVQRLVRRDRPRRGGPDDDPAGLGRQRFQRHVEGARDLVGLREREADIDRQVGLVLVLDLGLGQRRTAVEAPVDRLQAAEDVALLQDLAQRPDLVGLVAEVHRQVGVVPVAQHAQPFEVLALAGDLLGRVGARLGLDLLHRQALAVLLLDLDLDRHAVAVPARHVDGVEPAQAAGLDDHVLQDLVDGVADVDVAVGVRGAVVQHEFLRAAARRADRLVDLLFLPLLDPQRLALGQVAPHRERGVEQVDRVFVLLGVLVLRLGAGLGLLGVGHDDSQGDSVSAQAGRCGLAQ